MKRYIVKYQLTGSTSVSSMQVSASSASQAREKVKSQYNGRVKIISCVEM